MATPSFGRTSEELARENEELRAQLAEAQEVIRAIQSGDVDAVVISGPQGEQVFTLKGAEYAYRVLVEAMNESAAALAADATVLYCNQRLSDLLEIPLEQIIGGPVTKLVASDSQSTFEGLFANALATRPGKAELHLQGRSGRQLPVQVSLRDMSADGSTGVCMVVTNLTERKQRDELIAAGELARSILESAAEAIAVCGEAGHIIAANEGMKQLCGVNPLFRHFDTVLPLRVGSKPAGELARFSIAAALTGETQRALEVTFDRGHGEKLWLLLTVGRLASHSGAAGCVVTLTEITERKRAEEMLRASEARYRDLTESIPAMLWAADTQGVTTDHNRRWHEYSGQNPEQARGDGWQEIIFPEDVPRVAERWGQSIRTGEDYSIEYRIRRASDGTYRWHAVQAMLRKDQRGMPLGWFGTCIDIEDRKRAEAALRESEERNRLLAETMLQGVVHQDADGKIIAMNPAAERILGKTREEFLGSTSLREGYRTIREDGSPFPGLEHPAMVALRTGQPSHGLVMGVFNPQAGAYRWISIDALPLFRPGESSPSQVYTVFADITERRKAEAELERHRHHLEELVRERTTELENANAQLQATITEREQAQEAFRESESAFATLANLVPQLVWMCTPDGLNVYFNQRWVEYTGLTLEESYGRGWNTPFHPDDKQAAWDAWNHATQTGENYRVESRLRAADGNYRWFLMLGEPLRNAQGSVVRWFGTCTDIEDLKQAEEALKIQEAQLRALTTRLQQVREEERAMVARDLHDQIGQILTAIKMDMTWLARRLPEKKGEAHDRIKKAIELISDGARSMRKICSGLRPGILDDLGLAAAIEWQAGEFASRTGVSCQVSLPQDDLQLDGDLATAIFRIFQESLTNVARHAEAQAVRASLYTQNGNLLLVVVDDGKGFREAEISGSLGLLGMKERAQACGGDLQISSSPGDGTTVTVRVPCTAMRRA